MNAHAAPVPVSQVPAPHSLAELGSRLKQVNDEYRSLVRAHSDRVRHARMAELRSQRLMLITLMFQLERAAATAR